MIDRQTVEKILDTADIVDVVSDFVALKKRGVNWVGLCPFHNDRKPSFYVTRAKGYCKCFSCGEGGSPVGFIMKHEQMSYPEALKYLANKYHIEIEERELTDEERQQQSEQESMFIINEFAMNFFEKQLYETQEGKDIGLSYFRERGFSDESIKNFHLGYSPDKSSALHDAAVQAGYNEQILLKVGLCGQDDKGRWYDKFKGRVIFPIFTMSGKVVAFGGRTLHNHHAKYLNSPESAIYRKRKTIYGMAQAKREIAKIDKCFIVEGYADVISMHQAGFKNVIATSGTALTIEHIHSIRNLTKNVTELFDGDAAGIKAALKGVDMLLKQDMNIKVLVLPSPEDPDSFAQSHSASEISEYIEQHEQDFIDFKTEILLKDCERDPILRSKAIESVLRSVAVIPNEITRSLYAKECVDKFQLGESVITTQIERYKAQIIEEERKNREREKRQKEYDEKRQAQIAESQAIPPTPPAPDFSANPQNQGQFTPTNALASQDKTLQKCEYDVIKCIVEYGCSLIFEYENTTVVKWFSKEIAEDSLNFTNPFYKKVFDLCLEIHADFSSAFANYMDLINKKQEDLFKLEISKIQSTFVGNSQEIERIEEETRAAIKLRFKDEIEEYRHIYIYKHLSSNPDEKIRNIANEMFLPKHSLSKIHLESSTPTADSQKLIFLVSSAMFNWKLSIIEMNIKQLESELKTASINRQLEILKDIKELNSLKIEFAKLTGERVVNPKIMR